MKAHAGLQTNGKLTAAQLRVRLAEREELIVRKTRQREALRESLERLILEHTGPELAAPGEREQLDGLSAELEKLGRDRAVFEAEIADADRREREAQFREALAESKSEGDELVALAAAMQEKIRGVVKDAATFRERYAEWEAKLPGSHPPDYLRGELVATLTRHMEMANYVESEGALRPLRVIESPFEMKQAGRGDLARLTREHVTVALRNRQPRALTR